jgi:hypothetical protein
LIHGIGIGKNNEFTFGFWYGEIKSRSFSKPGFLANQFYAGVFALFDDLVGAVGRAIGNENDFRASLKTSRYEIM